MPSVALARYDVACQALADAKAVDEVRQILHVADALRAYARQAKNKALEVDAAEIRIRAERRVGELMQAQRETVGLAQGGQPYQATGSNLDPVNTPPTLADAGIDKHLADRARKLAAVPSAEFQAELQQWRERAQVESARVTANLIRAGEREQIRADRAAVAHLAGAYQLLYADPPWRYEHVKTESRAVENQYPTMSLEEICGLSIPAAAEAVLFMWATSPKLAEAMQVIAAWGFTYRTCAVWDKDRIGMGYYFRQQHELLLVGARGAMAVPEPSDRPPSVFRIRRDEAHSQKPDQVYAMLEQMYPTFGDADRVELFARAPRDGWSAWGNDPAVAS